MNSWSIEGREYQQLQLVHYTLYVDQGLCSKPRNVLKMILCDQMPNRMEVNFQIILRIAKKNLKMFATSQVSLKTITMVFSKRK